MAAIPQRYTLAETIRLKLEHRGLSGRMLTLFVKISHSAFFLFVIVALLTALALFGAGMRNGNPTALSLLGLIPLPIIIFVYAFIMANVPQRETIGEGGEEIEVRKRNPQSDELALGFAFGKEEDTVIQQLKGIQDKDRSTHMHVIGGSGTGKTKFLESIINQDIEAGRGFAVIDPHGDLTDTIKGLLAIQYHEYSDFLRESVVLLDPLNPEAPVVNFNPLERPPGISSAEQAAALVGVLKKMWESSWGVRMEDLLRNSFIALSENNLTIADLPTFLDDESFRTRVLGKVSHPICQAYFERYNALSKGAQMQWSEPILNKINAILSDERIRDIFNAPKSSFNLRDVMDNGKIFLARLDRGRLQGGGDLLGAVLVSAFQLAAFSRTNIAQSKRRRFYLYIDEFQNFATDSFIEMLAEARKYALSLVMAHQNLTQIPLSLRASLMANSGIQIMFRLSRSDASLLSKETMTAIHSTGWEQPTQMLQTLPPRVCIAHNKVAGGVVIIHTLDVNMPHVEAGASEEQFAEFVDSLHIGEKYLVPRGEFAHAQRIGTAKIESRDPESNRHPVQ